MRLILLGAIQLFALAVALDRTVPERPYHSHDMPLPDSGRDLSHEP